MNNPRPLVFISMRFGSTNRLRAEVKAIREKENQVDVIITLSNGDQFEEKNWNYQMLLDGMRTGYYFELKPEINFGI